MKIPLSIREAYESQIDLNRCLREVVDEALRKLKRPRWHYESRLKELQSFAVKIETGRVRKPDAVDDFFACTLVVPNSTELQQAEMIVRGSFDVKYQRPTDPAETRKEATAFPFDDLRLYVTRKNPGSLPPTPLDEVVFEIQIKTFLQHAWSIATHDLNSKTDEVRWSKDRIAALLRAMVEHAELSIQEATALSDSEMLSKTDGPTRTLAEIIAVLKTHWVRGDLPDNIRSLAQAVQPILAALHMRPRDLNDLLNTEKMAGHGGFDLNLSPYGVIMQGLLRHRTAECTALLGDPNARVRIVVTREMQLPDGLDATGLRNVIMVG
jgi:ppGpp synthetase/RelA/SpoT-type nucleotidyltranferase